MRRESWLPAAPESARLARAIVRDTASALQLDGSATWELMLATSEAFSNAVEHGRPCDPRGILLRLERRGGQLVVEVSDCGCFPPDARTQKRGDEGGRGIRIIAAVVDHLEVVRDAGATRVRFGKRLALG
jgi:anti-sigma regulatory factor (Ser/Thr protein kinase)